MPSQHPPEPHAPPAGWQTARMTTQERPAQTGDLCTCGRQAAVVFTTEQFGDVGYCGLEGAASRPVLPCPWCGTSEAHLESWGDPGRCPDYTLRPGPREDAGA